MAVQMRSSMCMTWVNRWPRVSVPRLSNCEVLISQQPLLPPLSPELRKPPPPRRSPASPAFQLPRQVSLCGRSVQLGPSLHHACSRGQSLRHASHQGWVLGCCPPLHGLSHLPQLCIHRLVLFQAVADEERWTTQLLCSPCLAPSLSFIPPLLLRSAVGPWGEGQAQQACSRGGSRGGR